VPLGASFPRSSSYDRDDARYAARVIEERLGNAVMPFDAATALSLTSVPLAGDQVASLSNLPTGER
jgi:hypothetical protein